MSAFGPSYPSEAVGGGDSTVTPPSPTSESVASGSNFSAKTFGSFTDPDGIIASYQAVTTNSTGSTSWSGSGLGAYTATSSAGDAGTLSLNAKDSSGNIVATAIHSYERAAAASGGLTSLLDWSSASESFGSGAGSYTIGGLSVTLSFNGTSGPSSLGLSSGVLTFTGNASSNQGYLVIDLGEDLDDGAFVVYVSCENVSHDGSNASILWKVADNTTVGNAANQYQVLVPLTSSNTTVREREAGGSSGPFATLQDRTVTNITTTPTLMGVQFLGGAYLPCLSQGSATLPTNGALFGTIGPNGYQDGSGTAAPQNRRYVHLFLLQNCTVRVAAYRLKV
tara:strand:- start:66 stop:1076 length:1011 start_codon:yes stop_codon:yes gene_type:complete